MNDIWILVCSELSESVKEGSFLGRFLSQKCEPFSNCLGPVSVTANLTVRSLVSRIYCTLEGCRASVVFIIEILEDWSNLFATWRREVTVNIITVLSCSPNFQLSAFSPPSKSAKKIENREDRRCTAWNLKSNLRIICHDVRGLGSLFQRQQALLLLLYPRKQVRSRHLCFRRM